MAMCPSGRSGASAKARSAATRARSLKAEVGKLMRPMSDAVCDSLAQAAA